MSFWMKGIIRCFRKYSVSFLRINASVNYIILALIDYFGILCGVFRQLRGESAFAAVREDKCVNCENDI